MGGEDRAGGGGRAEMEAAMLSQARAAGGFDGDDESWKPPRSPAGPATAARPGRVPVSGSDGAGGVVIHAGLQVSEADGNGAPSSQPP